MQPTLSWNHLSRARRLLLMALWGMAACVVVLTVMYVLASGTPVVASTPDATAVAYQTPPPLAPQLAGQFILLQGHALLTLRQYDDAITGTLTVQTCSKRQARQTIRIVTGQALPDGTVRLTFSAPDQSHSQATIYLVSPTPDGFAWQWHDAKGHLQLQRWQLTTGTLGPCPTPQA